MNTKKIQKNTAKIKKSVEEIEDEIAPKRAVTHGDPIVELY